MTTWHVSPSGAAASPGTQGSPTSITNAFASGTGAQPGDTVLCAGTWSNVGVIVHISGSAGNEITIQPEPGQHAIFDGVGSNNVILNIASRSYLTFDGIEFDNTDWVTDTANFRGIILRSSSYLQFKNCTFDHVSMTIYGCDNCTIGDASSDRSNPSNVWRNMCTWVQDINSVYQPQTAGDMLILLPNTVPNPDVQCHDILIQGNDMANAGHACISIGDGLGDAIGASYADCIVRENYLHNPWYRQIAICDDGAGTIVEDNDFRDGTTDQYLYSTVPGQVGALKTSSNAMQLTGAKNYIVRRNLFRNNVCTYAALDIGSWWYQQGTWYLVESMDNEIYENVFWSNEGAAAIAMIQFYTQADATAGRLNGAGAAAAPRLTGNDIHDNVIKHGVGTVYDWTANPDQSATGSAQYRPIMVHAVTKVAAWTGLNGNLVYDNELDVDASEVLLLDFYDTTPNPDVVVHTPKSLSQFNGLDANVYGNVLFTGIDVDFTDSSTDGPSGPITDWLWDFGDGDSDTVQNPTHTYATAAIYNVRLQVTGTGSDGTSAISKRVDLL